MSTPSRDEIDESVRHARREALKPLPWPARDADRTRRQETLSGGVVRYYYGGFFVDVGEDGRIVVNVDDWLSKYALAIDGTLDVRGKFLRIENGKLAAINNDNLIRTGETLVHRATAEQHRLNALFGERLMMQRRLEPAKHADRIDQLLRIQQQILLEGARPSPLAGMMRTRDEEAVRLLIDYAKSRLESVDKLNEQEKQDYFLADSTATIAILLYEFATGTGLQYRQFDQKHAITASLKSSRITQDILESFALSNANQTDITQLVATPADKLEGYAFSPDQTKNLFESLGKHIHAAQAIGLGNDLYLFLGGVSYRVDVDVPKESLRILIRDAKTARSLFLHAVESRDRINFQETPLGTTNQDYVFSVPIPWELIHMSGP